METIQRLLETEGRSNSEQSVDQSFQNVSKAVVGRESTVYETPLSAEKNNVSSDLSNLKSSEHRLGQQTNSKLIIEGLEEL